MPLFHFLPHFDVICNLLLNRTRVTLNLFVHETIYYHISKQIGPFYGRKRTLVMSSHLCRRYGNTGMLCILTCSSMLLIQVSSVPALQAIKACTVSVQGKDPFIFNMSNIASLLLRHKQGGAFNVI